MWPSESLNSFKFLVPSIWSIDFMRGTNTIGTLGGFGTNYIIFRKFSNFEKKEFPKIFSLVKENEESFEIFLKKNIQK